MKDGDFLRVVQHCHEMSMKDAFFMLLDWSLPVVNKLGLVDCSNNAANVGLVPFFCASQPTRCPPVKQLINLNWVKCIGFNSLLC